MENMVQKIYPTTITYIILAEHTTERMKYVIPEN
jgi:hypothetical protein